MKSHFFYSETVVKRPIEEVFQFFSKAENLDLLTPPELQFKILTPMPIAMQQGTHIDYKLKLNGISFSWKTEISEWNPPYSFVDKQLKGPYRIWIHEHSFIQEGAVTRMIDRVEYLAPGWLLEPLINRWFVAERVNKIFAFREQRLQTLFA